MPLLTILIDIMAFSGYYLQDSLRTNPIFIVGFIFQILVVLVLLVFTFGYHGKRREKHDYTFKGYRYFTLRYAIIVVSLFINAAVLFLYYLHLSGAENLIFN